MSTNNPSWKSAVLESSAKVETKAWNGTRLGGGTSYLNIIHEFFFGGRVAEFFFWGGGESSPKKGPPRKPACLILIAEQENKLHPQLGPTDYYTNKILHQDENLSSDFKHKIIQ